MTNKKKKNRRKAQTNVMALKWETWAREAAEMMMWGKTRPEKDARRDIREVVIDMLQANRRLSMEQLYLEHRARAIGLSIKQAVAEVDLYHAKVMQALRDEGMLIYPVTQAGWDGTYGSDISKAIPGRGRGQSVFGWHLAVGPDPLFNSYWGMRLGPVRGGLTKAIDTSERAAIAGVIPKAISRDVLKELPSEISN